MTHRKHPIIALCLLLGCSFGFADNPANPAPAAPVQQTNAPAAAPATASPPAQAVPNAPPAQAPAAAEAKGSDRNIRFQFDGLPYMDVITRFAQMVNKPLVSDTKVDGTITFNDPKPYNYPEALETLNLVLSLKGVMLVEADRYLRLVPVKEIPQMPLRIFKGVEKTGDAQPGEVVTVVLSLKNLEATEVAQSISSMLSNAGSVAPLSRGRGLIITDRLENIKRIRELLEEVDTASPVQREMKSFTLLNSSGAVLVDMINRTFGIATAPRRVEFNQQTKTYHQLPPDVNDYITAVFDDASRTLVLFGPADRVKLAEELIRRFEDKSGVAAGDVKIFYPQGMSAQEMARMVRQAVPSVAGEGETGPAAALKTRLIVDFLSNRLIVSAAAANQLDEIEKFVKKIDVVSDSAGSSSTNRSPDMSVTKIFRCQNAEPESVVRILIETIVGPGPRGRMFKALVDPTSRSIVLTGPQMDINRAMEIVKQLDSDEPVNRVFKMVSLKSARPSDLVTKLRPLYQDQSKNLQEQKAPEPLIMPDDVGSRLIITATAGQLKLIEDLIGKLDSAPDSSNRELKAINLHYTSANSVAAMLSQLYGRQFRSEDPRERVVITPSADDRTVLIETAPPVMARLEEAIKVLDAEPIRGVVEVRTYHLAEANAAELAQTLARLFQDDGRRKDVTQVPPRFEADPASNSLIVAATKEQFEHIDRLVKELKTSMDVATEVRTYKLTFCQPEQMVQLLETMLRDQSLANQYRRMRNAAYGYWAPVSESSNLRIAAAPAQNSVVIQGPPEKLRAAEELIKALDREQTDASSTIRTVHLKKAQADAVAESVNKTLDARNKGGQVRRTSVTPVRGSNSVLIDGPSQQADEVLKLIQDLDQESSGGDVEFHIYKLENGNVQEVSRILGQMLDSMSRTQSRFGRATANIPVTVAVDERSNSLIVSASPESFKVIEKLITSLDQAPRHTDRAMNLYTLINADPWDLANKLAAMFADRSKDDQVSAEPDYYSNTLTIVAPRKDMEEIDALVKKLDAAAVDTRLQVRMVALDKLPAMQLANMLTNIYSQMAPGPVRLVDKLPPPKDKNTSKSTPISVSSTNPAAIVNGTNESAVTVAATNQSAAPFFPEVVIAVDKTANALLLSGPAHELDRIQSIIRDLMRAAASNDTELRLYPLQEADPIVVARTLNELFRPENGNQGNNQYGGYRQGRRGGFQNGQQQFFMMPPARVSVVPEPRTRSIIVRAQPTDFMLLENLIKQLDVAGPNAQLGFRLVPLENTQADKLQPLVQQMVAQMRIARPGEPVTITRDPRGNAMFIVARTTMLDQLESMITELDVPASNAEGDVLLVQLKNGDSAQLANILNNMLKPGGQGELTQEAQELQEQVRRLKVQNEKGEPVVLDLTKPIKIMSDRARGGQGGNNRLVLVSTPDNLKALSAVVAMMDTVPAMANVRVFPLRYSDPTTIQRMLAELYSGPNSAKLRPEDHPSIAVDERTSSLIVSGNETAFAMVTNLLDHLDKEGVATNSQIRVLALKHATAQTLSGALNTLFSERYAARSPELQRNRPVIIPDPRSNSLMIAANNEDTQVIDGLLQKLDREPENPAVSIKVIGLKHNDATRVAGMLSGVFSAHRQSITAPGQPVVPADQVYIQADPLVNAIVVSASPENFEILNGLLAEIDVEPVVQEGLIQTFTLKQADAQRAATMLRSLIDQGIYRPGMAAGNRRSPRDAIALTVDPRANTLIISASPENMMVVKELIKQIDSQDYAEGGDIKLFQLKHAKASQLATVLEQFFRSKRSGEAVAGGGDRSIPVTVTPDDRTSTLLVTGGKETFAAIERMVAQLDAEPIIARTQFKVVPLKQATAAKLQSTLMQLFMRRPSTIRGEPPDPISIVADSWANALVVGASPEDLTMVESLIAQLDNDQTEPGMEVQVMPLVKADVRQVAQTITSLYRTGGPGTASPVTVNIDERLNAVVVSAGQSDIKRIAELVKKLDTDQVTQVCEIRIFTLTNARAQQLSLILDSVLNNKPIPLTAQSPSRQALLQFLGKTEDGKDLMTTALKEGVLITADTRANALVVSAPVEYMKLLQQLIERLDTTSPQLASIKVFPLKNADARQMMVVLTTLFHLQQSTQSTGNNRTIQYNMVKAPQDTLTDEASSTSAVMGTAEETALTVTVDLRSNSLLVGGSDHYVTLASELIETLDSSPAQERKAEVYRLKNSRAVEIQAALQNFLRQDLQLISSAVGQQAMAQELLEHQAAIVAETNSNTLLISASPRNFAQLEELVKQLDLPQRQVLIQVLLAEVTLTTSDELGVEWSYQSGGNPATRTGTDFGLPEALKNYGGFASSVSGSHFNFLFRALENEGRLRVLSRPQILTADNQEATIKVGQQVPIVSSSQVIAQNGNNVNTFEYKDVGVNLAVTPRISPDGFVKMDVTPEITQLSSSTVTISPGFQAQIINQRMANTAVSVQSGQSILIGGLISSTDDSNTKSIPFLGKIPLLGALFRSNTKNNSRTELLILLTPQVLDYGEEHGTTRLSSEVTREQLDRSTMKNNFKSDALEKQVLEPYYPDLKTNAPSSKTIKGTK